MGVDISGGLLIGAHASKICVDIDVLLENDDMVKYAEYYDAPDKYCHIGFKINNVLVSEMNVEWLAHINELAKRFESLTGAKAELIGCQDIW